MSQRKIGEFGEVFNEAGPHTHDAITKLTKAIEGLDGMTSRVYDRAARKIIIAGGDHGTLVGLEDNDHTQYLMTAASGLYRASQTVGINYRAPHWYSPSGNFASIGVSGVAGQSADMATWQPSGLYRTHVDGSGSIGINDSTPTAQLSIRSVASTVLGPAAYLATHAGEEILRAGPADGFPWLLPAATSITCEFFVNVPVGYSGQTHTIFGQGGGSRWVFKTYFTSGKFATNQLNTFYDGEISTGGSSVDIRDGKWHHYAFTISDNPRVIRQYVDGSPQGTSTGGTWWDMRTGAPFGGDGVTDSLNFNWDNETTHWSGLRIKGCLIRSGLVYTGAFTPPVGYLLPSGTHGSYSNLLFYCPMDEGTGQTLRNYASYTSGIHMRLGINSSIEIGNDMHWESVPFVTAYDVNKTLEDWKDVSGNVSSKVDGNLNWGLGTGSGTIDERLHVSGNIKATGTIYAPVISGNVVSGMNIFGSALVSGLVGRFGTAIIRGQDTDVRYALSGALYGNGTSGTLPVYDGTAHLRNSIAAQVDLGGAFALQITDPYHGGVAWLTPDYYGLGQSRIYAFPPVDVGFGCFLVGSQTSGISGYLPVYSEAALISPSNFLITGSFLSGIGLEATSGVFGVLSVHGQDTDARYSISGSAIAELHNEFVASGITRTVAARQQILVYERYEIDAGALLDIQPSGRLVILLDVI